MSVWMIANSSPPTREIVSVSRTQPRSRPATARKQLVADRVPERIVDVLEVVEVEAQHREPLPAFNMDERLGQPLAQQHAVGQIGQRIVTRHVRDLHFRPAPLGDVLVGGHPAAAGHRHVHHGDGAAVVQLDELAGRRAGLDGRGEALEVLVDVPRKGSGGGASFEQLLGA